ncbi:response regulator [Prosthecochloris sp. HL-130-GSB]|uniref:ATP-binding response regulator n=1 Tax=Prosthecochloris sp. HL-130-GSB TaxID=1974213 RepID=UPI000A1C185A|nr:response regulator [Prosthecochloris sp. HL-130-GSB]ARM31299.1 hypothetical protein B9H02_08330 [Prosthecochloris sp. HL-130-GSB]
MPPLHIQITSFLKKASDLLRQDFEQHRLTMDLIRYIALWGHPLYYVLCAVIFPQPYESLVLRMASPITFIPLLFFKRYPDALKPWINIYWYLWLAFTFPFIFTFLMLMNDFSGLWLVAETVMVFVFIIFIPNVIIMSALLVAGIVSAQAAYTYVTGNHVILTTDIVEYFISVPIAILLGIVLNYTSKKSAMAEERSRLLQALAGSIAHEMRNPLGQVRHCLNGIQKLLPNFHHKTPSVHLDRHTLHHIYHRVAHGQLAVKRGVQVIDMILGEIRENPINPDSFTYLSAARITRKALEEYGYDSEEERSRVDLDARETFMFHISETLFIFILFNLLKNALYYIGSHPDSSISIKLARGADLNSIIFRDTGPGISPEDLPHIFDSFHTKGKKGGTGLGLAYCKRIMRAFGGDITCKSVKGSYTEFTMTFPVVDKKKLEKFNAGVIENARPDFEGKRILVVDDEHNQRTVIQQFLRPLGVEIDEAASGHEALELTAKNRYDLIIMDIVMPGMNGYEVTEKIRENRSGRTDVKTPVVAFSSEPAYIAKPMAEKAGMQDLISKPCSQSELINGLRSVLKQEINATLDQDLISTSRILLVDDSALNRSLLAMVLTNTGLYPATAVNGQEGWEMLNQEPFDLLITDIHMPAMDGLELTRRLRNSSNPILQALPIIGLSGSEEEEKAARQAGMNDFKLKTDNPEVLVNSVETLLASSKKKNGAQPAACPVVTIDFRASAESLGIPEDKLKTMFGQFVDESCALADLMRKALEQEDLDTIREEAHKIKGTVSMFGAEHVRKAAENLERSCSTNSLEELEQQLEKLIDIIRELGDHKT